MVVVLERVLSKGKHTVKGFQLEVSGQSFVSQEPQPKTVQHKDTGSDLVVIFIYDFHKKLGSLLEKVLLRDTINYHYW